MPAAIELEVLTFITELQLGLQLVGLKLAVMPAGSPLAENATDCAVPAVRVLVTVAVMLLPRYTLPLAGLTETLKSNAGIKVKLPEAELVDNCVPDMPPS
jgi:hypothetical protein